MFPRMGPCRKSDGCEQGQQRRPQPPFRTEHRSERQTVAEQEDSGQQVLLHGQAVQGGAQVFQSITPRWFTVRLHPHAVVRKATAKE